VSNRSHGASRKPVGNHIHEIATTGIEGRHPPAGFGRPGGSLAEAMGKKP